MIDTVCQGCGAALRSDRLTICKCTGKVVDGDAPKQIPIPKPPTEFQPPLPCIHRGQSIGVAACGCSGKPTVHWCSLLNGHCTVRSTGKTWQKTVDGFERIGNLKPCIVCEKRNLKEPNAKQLLNKTIPQWHYITVDEYARDVVDFARRLPPISGVAGVPASGDMAFLIASKLHVPWYEASAEFGLRRRAQGQRGSSRKVNPALPILILDDTVSTGYEMSRIKRKLGSGNYLYAAIYAKQSGMHQLDYYGAEFGEPHLLEWNIDNSGYIAGLAPDSNVGGAGIAFDLDGVIASDPPRFFNERDVRDREAYKEWLANAEIGPIVPRMVEIPLIVSYRCEYTRELTEAWLAKQGVRYKELRLWPDAVDARPFDGRWKADAYAEKNYGLFIESDHDQAKAIAEMTGKKVLCADTRKVY